MRIKALDRHPRRERVRIRFEGDEAPPADAPGDRRTVELALDLVLRRGLAPGDELSAVELEALEREDEGYRAREAALRLLAHRARSTDELRRRLARKGFGSGVVESTLEAMADLGYLDDAAFAAAFVRDRLRLRPRGRLGLIRELQRRGVRSDAAETAVADVMGEEGVDDAGLAADAAAAWARKNRPAIRRSARGREERTRARRRLYGHLARRGFAPDSIRAAIADILG